MTKRYAIGYGKPPVATRFQKGRSGNPRGRPRNRQRALEMIESELFRTLHLREGDASIKMPALQAVVRSHVTAALKGNGPAQRAVIALSQLLEEAGGSIGPGANENAPPKREMSAIERARRVALILAKANREIQKKGGA